MKQFLLRAQKGFTLIEILIVIGIIAILAAIVIIAINPAKQFAQARNTQRESNVNTILNAIGQNVADNKGVFTCGTVTLPPVATFDAAAGTLIGTDSGKIDLTCLKDTYIPTAIPTDPGGTLSSGSVAAGTPGNTGYTVQVNSVGRVSVCAPNHAETSIPGATTYCLTR
ncbi:MAG TPA: prepilin-type N-terminal cleavage/methylation domain-containing protein [Candidatus Paceibacterota bacterium]|nr:prepilin-type N-terminal cleavage/methylation domain-containing protein [Candidatus Paceibacterota bacterium]